MPKTKPKQTLLHPQFGVLPARRVLDCIFALQPDGSILHRHIDDVISEMSNGIRYVLQDRPPSPAQARCRIIPPLVPEF